MLPSICRIQPHGHSRLKTQILYQQCQAESQSMKTIQELAPLTRIYSMRCPSIDTLRKCQVRVCNLTAELSINTYKDSILRERAGRTWRQDRVYPNGTDIISIHF